MKFDYHSVTGLNLYATCTNVSLGQWEKLMKGKTRANKKLVDRLVKKHMPDLYDSLALNFYNPYNYYKTDKHIILIHSAIEYFLTFYTK